MEIDTFLGDLLRFMVSYVAYNVRPSLIFSLQTSSSSQLVY